MIQVTLTFSSINAAIKALRDIPEADLALPLAGNVVPAAKPEKADPKPEKAKTEKADAKPVQTAPTSPTAEAGKDAAPAKKEEPSALVDANGEDVSTEAWYKTNLQKAVFDLAAKSRDAVVEVLSTFGVKKATELPVEKRLEALGAVKTKLAELEVA